MYLDHIVDKYQCLSNDINLTFLDLFEAFLDDQKMKRKPAALFKQVQVAYG